MADIPAGTITVTVNSDGTVTWQEYTGNPLLSNTQMLTQQFIFTSAQWTAIKAQTSGSGSLSYNLAQTTSDLQEGFAQIFNQT